MDSIRHVPSLSRFTTLCTSNDDHEIVLQQKGSSLKVQAHFRGRLIEIFAPAYARRQHKLAAEAFIASVEQALAAGDPALASRFGHTDKLDRKARLTLIDGLRERLADQLSGAHALTAHDVQDALAELSHQLTGMSYLRLAEQSCEGAKALIIDLEAKGLVIDVPGLGSRPVINASSALCDEDLVQAHAMCKELCDAFKLLKPNLHLQHYIGDVEQTAMMLEHASRAEEARDLFGIVDSIRNSQNEVTLLDSQMKSLFDWLSRQIDDEAQA